MLGGAPRLLSTVLQSFSQSNLATAAACQVNNLHLLRGMLGRRRAAAMAAKRSDPSHGWGRCWA
jgi:hypothetical protein